MTPRRPQLASRLVSWLAVCAGLVGLPPALGADTVWELTPYRVQILWACQSAPQLTPLVQEDLAAGLQTRLDALAARQHGCRRSSFTATGHDRPIAAGDREPAPKESLELDKVMPWPFCEVRQVTLCSAS